MSKEISQKSFNQIKLIVKFLSKAKNLDSSGSDLSALPGKLESKVEDTLPYNETLGEFMSDNSDLFYAGNLNIYTSDSEILAYTCNQDITNPNENPFNYTELYNRLSKLLRLGRNGIDKLEVRNITLSQIIYKLQNEMNMIK